MKLLILKSEMKRRRWDGEGQRHVHNLQPAAHPQEVGGKAEDDGEQNGGKRDEQEAAGDAVKGEGGGGGNEETGEETEEMGEGERTREEEGESKLEEN